MCVCVCEWGTVGEKKTLMERPVKNNSGAQVFRSTKTFYSQSVICPASSHILLSPVVEAIRAVVFLQEEMLNNFGSMGSCTVYMGDLM